jgi:hypothetical protein
MGDSTKIFFFVELFLSKTTPDESLSILNFDLIMAFIFLL